MATKVGSLLIKLGLESGAFHSGLKDADRQLKKATKAFEQQGRAMQAMGQQLSMALTLPLVGFAGIAAKVASDAAELQSAFNQTFGDMASQMSSWAEATGNAMGRSTQEMQRGANSFGMFFNQAAKTNEEAIKMSQNFTVLAQDLASFFNVDPGEAMQKLMSGLSGEAEPLRAFGIFLNEGAVKAKAMEMGLAGANGEVSDQAKIMARAQLILEGTTKAQGDVARTSDGAANKARSFKSAVEELQVAIGNKLLPVLTPIITAATNMVTAFSNLSPGVQTTVIALGAVAAAAGPVMYIFGGLMQLVAPLSAAFSLIAGAGGMAGVTATLTALGTAAVPILPIIAGIAAAGAVLYANWGKIAPVLQETADAIMKAVGPQITELVNTAREAWADFAGSQFMADLKQIIGLVGDFVAIVLRGIGGALPGVFQAIGSIVVGAFKVIIDAVKMVNALLQGDFAGAWTNAQALVKHAVEGIGGAIWFMVEAAAGAVKGLYEGIKLWLNTRLGEVLNWLAEKLGWAGQLFFKLYDAVVGHSYIPDMVDGIGHHIGRLDREMVHPIEQATARSALAFKKLTESVGKSMADLGKGNRAALGDRGKLRLGLAGIFGGAEDPLMAALKAGPGFGGNAGAFKLGQQGIFAKAQNDNPFFGQLAPMDPATAAKFKQATKLMQVELATVGAINVRVSKSFKDMADATLSAVDRMAKAFSGGSFLDKLGAVLNLGLQLGQAGVFGKNFQGKLNSVPGFANGTSFAPGGIALVGERGPELVNLPRGSQVIPNHQLNAGGGNTYHFQGNMMTPEFWNMIHAGDQGAAQAGARAGQARMAFHQSRRVA